MLWRKLLVRLDMAPGNSAADPCLILSYECGPQMLLQNATWISLLEKIL